MCTLVSQVLEFIQTQPHIKRYIVAYSGGVDSHVLLHIMQRLLLSLPKLSVQAVHVNHNLHPDSALWEEHCKQTCVRLNLPIAVHSIKVDRQSSESLEAKARELRYRCLQEHVTENTCVLTAHHQDDQAETLLLLLMRGSGPKGLSSMPILKPFASGYLGRPLLTSRQTDISGYSKKYHLSWIEDPSNQFIDFDRNFIRHEIVPRLQQRWPSATMAISRSALQCANLSGSLHSFAQKMLTGSLGTQPNTLSKTRLLDYSAADMGVLIRSWLQQSGITMPSVKQLDQIIRDIILSKVEATPCVGWGDYEMRRYRDNVYVGTHYPPFDNKPSSVLPNDTVNIPGLGEFYFEEKQGRGFIWPDNATKLLHICFRQGGETCQPVKRGHQHKLKKLLQEMAIPPWQRGRLPLLCDGQQIVAVADLLVCEPYATKKNQLGYCLKRRNNGEELC